MNIIAVSEGYVWARDESGELVEAYIDGTDLSQDMDEADYNRELVRRARRDSTSWMRLIQWHPESTEYAHVMAFIEELAAAQKDLIANA